MAVAVYEQPFCCRFSKQRHNMLWRSPSTSNLSQRLTQMSIDEEPDSLDALDLEGSMHDTCRPRSWSPSDSTPELLIKAKLIGELKSCKRGADILWLS